MNEDIKHELKKIDIPPELHFRAAQGAKQASSERPKRVQKRAIISLIASVLFVFSATVTGAISPSFNNLIATISPELADLLQPIQKTSIDNGIKMEVIAAMSDDEMSVIYLSMEDLDENRIDETIDIYDYFLSIGRMFNCQLISFDKQQKKAFFRLQANGNKQLHDKKIHLSVTSMLSHKHTFEQVEIDLLDQMNKQPNTILLDRMHSSGGGGGQRDSLFSEEQAEILYPGELAIKLPKIDFLTITNIGIIDDKLHVQVKWRENNVDDHGRLYLTNDNGKIQYASTVSFGVDNKGDLTYGSNYIEYIFDLQRIDLGDFQLKGDFVSNGLYMEGNWETTFRLESNLEEKTVALQEDFGDWTATNLAISPLGITINGTGQYEDDTSLTVKAIMTDGTVIHFNSIMNSADKEEVIIKLLPAYPLDISEIKTVTINELEIPL
ncbi:DUF4179 domain-containing protein [Metabacillus malikii]|uniref:DUF4179 domain-containing protein n=1 Tax=Metabacillus malikii TaxID=1504265 RepID=A0ABT9ZHX2_9BACI|nr:DUF4179 domain-containing protein [Metabacillus malikii]MDQ0231397.1 hypothetical protein [Metabacillus malikii]